MVGPPAVQSNRSADPLVVLVPREVTLTLNCLYSSDVFPSLTVYWYPEGSDLYGDGSSLIIDNPVNSITYYCVVENQVGSLSSKHITVQPIGEYEGGKCI